MKIIKYNYNMKECAACKRLFNGNSNNHRYCSESCKMLLGINWSLPCKITDVIGFHNQVAHKLNGFALEPELQREFGTSQRSALNCPY